MLLLLRPSVLEALMIRPRAYAVPVQEAQTVPLILFYFQMRHPIQMKPADSENRNGECHLRYFGYHRLEK